MQYKLVKKLYLAALISILGLVQVSAQADVKVKENSPYSRFGLGDLFPQNFAAQLGMGGLTAAYNDNLQINLLNPASLGSLEATSFDAGIFAKNTNLKNPTQQTTVWSGNLSYLSLGFTTRNRLNDVLDRKRRPWSWGMNFGLLPYTNVGYGVTRNSMVNDTTEFTNLFEGTGGTYKFYWGNGLRYKNFSAGINLGYLFGKISTERTIALIDEVAAYQVNTVREIGISGVFWNAGFQYEYIYKKQNSDGQMKPTGKRLVIGIYGNSATGFNTNTSLLEMRTNFQYTDLRDTIQSTSKIREHGRLPAEISVGMMMRKINKWRYGFDYTFTAWSGYENDPKPESLNDTWAAAIGAEYIPDHSSYNNYFKKIRYRAGAAYRQDPRFDLATASLTIGLGFPIILPRQAVSFINLALEAGMMSGDTRSLEESYIKATLGFSLNDNSWFFKRRFN